MKSALERVGRLSNLAVAASLLGVGALALGQPILDLLGRNPEFFIARRFPVVDIALLALALVLIPLVLFALVWLARRVGAVPARSVMIGDTPYDVAAARNAGVPLLGVLCGGWTPLKRAFNSAKNSETTTPAP